MYHMIVNYIVSPKYTFKIKHIPFIFLYIFFFIEAFVNINYFSSYVYANMYTNILQFPLILTNSRNTLIDTSNLM